MRNFQEGNVLVCGDSSTDIPMLKECLIRNPKGVYTIWVTVNDKLKEEVSFQKCFIQIQ